MARTREELAKLLEDLKGWFKQDFDNDYNKEALTPVMQELLQERFRKFLYRRIGHLPDADFISFVKLFDKAIPEVTAPVAVVEISKEAIEASKLEPEEFVKTHGSKKKKT